MNENTQCKLFKKSQPKVVNFKKKQYFRNNKFKLVHKIYRYLQKKNNKTGLNIFQKKAISETLSLTKNPREIFNKNPSKYTQNLTK